MSVTMVLPVPNGDIDSAVQQQRIALHRSGLATSVVASAGTALVLALLLRPQVAPDALGLWLAALAAALALRVGVGRAQARDPDADAHPARWLLRHRLAFAVHGLAWAGAAALGSPGAAHSPFEMVVFGLAAVAAGTLLSAAFDLTAAALFAAPALAALALGSVTGAPGGRGTTVMMLVFLGVTALTAVRAQRAARETVRLRLAGQARALETHRAGERVQRARAELADQHQLLTQVMHTTRQGFWFIGNDGVTTDVNPAMALMLGLPREQVVGRSVFDFFDGADLETVRREFNGRHLGAGGYEVALTRPDGSRLHCVNHATPLYDAAGVRTGAVGLWTDITVHRDAETRLKTFELVVNSITDLVSVTDEHEVYRLVNDAWCRATGVAREQALGRRSVDVLPAGVSEARRRALFEAVASGQTRTARGSASTPALAHRELETTYYPYAESAAGIRCVAMITRDITEQERGLQLLQKTEAEQRALLDAFPGYIGRLSPQLFYTYANERLAALYGTTPDRIVGRSVAEVLGPDPVPQLQARVDRVLAGETLTYEYHHPARGDRPATDVQVTLAAGSDPWTGAATVTGFGLDITWRKQAELALRATETEMRGLLAAFPGYLSAVDDRPAYTYINERLAAAMGGTAGGIVGRSVAEVIGPGRAVQVGDELRRALAGEVVVTERTYRHGGSGRRLDLEVTHVAGPRREDGSRSCYTFGVDITARKHAEEALIAARDEAERANRAKSQFLAQMSHELRTPLNAILGFGQLLESDAGQPLPDHQAGHVREILRGARHLLALINEILDLGRIEAGRLRLDSTPVDVAALVGECLALVQALAHEHGVRLRMPAPGDGATVAAKADQTRLRQVLLNLLGNAIKYNRRGGEVGAEFGRRGERVLITVRDDGPGLGPAEQARLFQPFERLGAATTGIEGTGIGLALSRRLVQGMGGDIGVDSEPGAGSAFWLTLPAADSTAAAAAPEPGADAPAGVPAAAPAAELQTVLYIEDNAVNMVLMAAMLARLPALRLVGAALPEEGLRLALAERPALILLDIQLPGIDGFEVLARLRADPATRPIPVVAVSANAVPSDIDAALAAGFTDYLTKPIELQSLHATVLRLLAAAPAG